MLSQCLSDPHILAIFGANKQDEVVSSGIVGVKEVCDYAKQAEAPRKEDKLILFAQLFEYVLLKFL